MLICLSVSLSASVSVTVSSFRFVDPAMLSVNNLYYASQSTIYFQRLSVIFSDLLLFYAIYTFARARAPWLPSDHKHSRATLLLLSFCSPGLLMVDHIHFQYNGFLLGLFILSLACMNAGRDLLGGVLFAVLINFKHIFLYVAPVYFIYLIYHYCMEETTERFEGWEGFNRTKTRVVFRWWSLFKLGSAVLLVFAVSLGPFIYHGQLAILKERLFPFKRGLSHAYWAPNIWALYNAADLVLTAIYRRMGGERTTGASFTGNQQQQNSSTSSTSRRQALTLSALLLSTAVLHRWIGY